MAVKKNAKYKEKAIVHIYYIKQKKEQKATHNSINNVQKKRSRERDGNKIEIGRSLYKRGGREKKESLRLGRPVISGTTVLTAGAPACPVLESADCPTVGPSPK